MDEIPENKTAFAGYSFMKNNQVSKNPEFA
jgi:hypothetical protein